MAAEDDLEMVQRYSLDPDESPSTGVVAVVSAVEDRSPLDLPSLGEVTDPDALDALLANGGESNSVSFDYCGYEVTATPDEIRVNHRDTQ